VSSAESDQALNESPQSTIGALAGRSIEPRASDADPAFDVSLYSQTFRKKAARRH
jgi:hypothetical protein